MEEQLIQLLSQYGIIGLLCYFAIKEFFMWLGKGKNGYDKKTYEVGNKIATNDLIHIHDELKKGNEWHEKQFEVLVQIRTILQERK